MLDAATERGWILLQEKLAVRGCTPRYKTVKASVEGEGLDA